MVACMHAQVGHCYLVTDLYHDINNAPQINYLSFDRLSAAISDADLRQRIHSAVFKAPLCLHLNLLCS